MRSLAIIFLILSLAGCAAPTPHAHYAHGIGTIPVSAAGDSFAWPVTGSMISPFGSKVDYIRNKGIDIQAEFGRAVRAARAGRVVFANDELKGFGKTVILDHGGNYQTVYAYNSEILVNVGDTVEQNDVIARVGKTGRAKSPSLHFEIRKDSRPQDPMSYLKH